MNSQVGLQVKVQRELLSTYVTLIRLLTLQTKFRLGVHRKRSTYCVHKHMALELGVVEEALAATLIVALELPIGLTVSFYESSLSMRKV